MPPVAKPAPDWLTAELQQWDRKSFSGFYEHPSGRKYFIKAIPHEQTDSLNEVRILIRLSSRYVRPLEWIWNHMSHLYLFSPWMDTSLQDVLNQRQKVSVDEGRRLFADLLKALEYLDESGVVHRNIKPASMLLTQSRRVKLGDFSVAVSLKGARSVVAPLAGCSVTLPPEAVEEIVSTAWDVWSAVVILFLMLTGIYPFTSEPNCVTHRDAVCSLLARINHRLVSPDTLGVICGQALILTQRVFRTSWCDRPSASELLRSEFIVGRPGFPPLSTFLPFRWLRERLTGLWLNLGSNSVGGSTPSLTPSASLGSSVGCSTQEIQDIYRTLDCYTCVMHRLKDSIKKESRQKRSPRRDTNPQGPFVLCRTHRKVTPVWIVHWADFTHHFGFCVAFSNGCSSILFNDYSNLSHATAPGITYYFDGDGQGLRFPLDCVPAGLTVKVARLEWWLQTVVPPDERKRKDSQLSMLRNWWRTDSGVLLLFDGIIQFDFIDGPRLVLTATHLLSFSDDGARVIQWNSAEISSVFRERLSFIDKVVDKIQLDGGNILEV